MKQKQIVRRVMIFICFDTLTVHKPEDVFGYLKKRVVMKRNFSFEFFQTPTEQD